jgi:tetratricopeptide (TPR) repeat protein
LLEKSFPHLQDRQLRTRAGIALVEIDYQRRDFESALVILNSLQKIDAANPDVLYVSYRIHADLAAQARDNLALAAPDSARMHQLLAEHLVTEGKIKDAVAQFREALQIDSRLPGVHFELGEALLQESASQDARQQAEQEFKTALEVNPADAKSECSLGALANARGESDLARQHYSRSAELDPMYAEAQIGLGALLASGQPNEALPHLLQAVRLDPMSSGAHFRLSQVYRRLGRTSEANDEIAKFKQLRAAERRLQAAYGQGNAVSVTEKLINPDELQ